MGYNILRPSKELAGFVKQYWAIEQCLPPNKVHIQRIVPNGLLELMFYLGDKPESLDKNKAITENSLITGQLREYYDIKVSGNLSVFSVIFEPCGLAVFFNIPVREFYNNQVPLKYILKDQVNELETKLSEAPTFLSKKEITEQFLLMQLKHSFKAYQFQRIKRSIDIINFRKGLVNIDFLASEACLSRKQYERNFSEYIGTSPRQFLKIVRFQHAIHKKSQDIKSSITDLTYTCGYFDQAHMTNDFNTLSGMTPRQYFMDCEPYSDYFQ